LWIKILNEEPDKPLLLPFGPSTLFIDAIEVNKAVVQKFVDEIEKNTGKKVQAINLQIAVVNWKYVHP